MIYEAFYHDKNDHKMSKRLGMYVEVCVIKKYVMHYILRATHTFNIGKTTCVTCVFVDKKISGKKLHSNIILRNLGFYCITLEFFCL